MKPDRFKTSHRNFSIKPGFLLLLGLALLTLSVLLWQTRQALDLALFASATADKARAFALATEFRYQTIYHALNTLAAKGIANDISDRAELNLDAQFFLDAFDGLDRVFWIDDSLMIQHEVPEQGVEGQSMTGIETDPTEVTLLQLIYQNDRFMGYLLGVVDLNGLMAPVEADINQEYLLQLSDQDGVIYSNGQKPSSREGLMTNMSLNLENTTVLVLTLAPTETAVQSITANARNTLLFSLGFSAIAVISVYFAQRATHQAFASQTRYQNLLQSSQEAIFIIDMEGRFQDANPAALQMVGYSQEEFLKLTVDDLRFTPEDKSEQDDADLWKSGGMVSKALRHKDGRAIEVALSVSPINEQGIQKWVMGIARDLSDQQRTSKLIQLRLELMDLSAEGTAEQVYQKTLDDVCVLTNSAIGFLHFVDSDQNTLSLQAWSTRTTVEFCQAEGIGQHYPVEQAGVWADCVYARQPVIHNDYAALPHRNGLPEGHATVLRELVVPIFREGKIVAIIGVGNKPDDYTQQDVDTVSYLGDVAWEVIAKKEAEDDRARQHALLEAILNHAPLLMVLVDEDLHIRQTNDFAAQFADRPPDEMAGLNWGEAMRCLNSLNSPAGCGSGAHCQACTVRSIVRETFVQGKSFQQIEATLPINVSGQDSQLSFLLSSTPLTIDKNPMALVTLMDITDLAQARSQAAQLLNQQKAINQLTLALGKTSHPATIYRTIFHHVRELLDVEVFEVLSYKLHTNTLSVDFAASRGEELNTADWPLIDLSAAPPNNLNRAVSTRQLQYDDSHQVLGLSKSKDALPGSSLSAPMMVMGDVIGVMHMESSRNNAYTQEDHYLVRAVAQNATLIDSLEQVVALRTNELEEKVQKLDKSQKAMLYMIEDLNQTAANLKVERQKLTQSNQELEAFSYSVSHDLRAPLRHINGYIDLLTRRFPDALPEKGRYYLDSIVDSSKEMGELIDSMLEFSRTSRQEMLLTRVDMNDLVKEAMINLKPDYIDRNIIWQVGTLPEVFGDRHLLKQVWLNLLSNAIKFTEKTPHAQIEVGALDEGAEDVFFVKDNGVGFEMKYANKLFGVFQRLHPASDYEGIGIGLANMRRIIQRHEGRTWAEGEPGVGATFYFSLPKR